jgi:uncharacterized radical SAM protein YgiQ
MDKHGWVELDILLITGDAYVDHPAFGAAMIGRVLEADGFRVGIIAQPDWKNPESLVAMGRPRLFCGITAGNLDSMLARYTAARHLRKEDEFSPGGKTGLRPNRASIVYSQLARRVFPGITIVLGGIEASLRRVAHYDFWGDRIRPSILSDSKADILVFGMGETAALEIARRLAKAAGSGLKVDLAGIRGTARFLGANESARLTEKNGKKDAVFLPSLEDLKSDRKNLLLLTRAVEREQNPFCGRRMVQFHGRRALVVEPPCEPPPENEMDRFYSLPFARMPHPSCREPIPAFKMIKESVTVVRGCPGGCAFCGLGLHQGKFLSVRSKKSVLGEIRKLAQKPGFSGTVTDLGGPTANCYGAANATAPECRTCRRPSCLFPRICKKFRIMDAKAAALLRDAAEIPGVRHLFVQSGIRIDLALRQPKYLKELLRRHVSGHLKVAPEHLARGVLKRMRKGGYGIFERFLEIFRKESSAARKEQYLVPYFMSSFPGCTEKDMDVVREYLRKHDWNLRQVQDFIPLPMTAAAAMYSTGLDYESGEPIPVARGAVARSRQKSKLHLDQKPAGRGRHGKKKHKGRNKGKQASS